MNKYIIYTFLMDSKNEPLLVYLRESLNGFYWNVDVDNATRFDSFLDAVDQIKHFRLQFTNKCKIKMI